MYITWAKAYETGHPVIDDQHKMLVFLFKRLDASIKTGQPSARVSRIVLETRKFVEFHFVSEENLMEETGFEGLADHRKMHAELLLEMNSMIEKVTSQREYPEDLLCFLNKWVVNHIGVHDRDAADHARTSSERPVAELFYMGFFPPWSSQPDATLCLTGGGASEFDPMGRNSPHGAEWPSSRLPLPPKAA